jgi:hypothetical protein
MGTRNSRKLKVMKETLRQLTPDQLGGVQGGGNGKGGAPEATADCTKDELVVRTRRCAC